MSSPRLFGTDGIRGAFASYPLDEPTVRRLGWALARRLGPSAHLVLGGDTRESTPTLSRWIAAGLASGGAGVTYLGTVPTPAVAQAARALGAAGGVAISASHNPHPDNGIKLLDGDGFKWPPSWESALESALESAPVDAAAAIPLEVDGDAVQGYLDSLAATLPGQRPLAGLSLAVDAGNGAAAPYAEELFTRLGARLTVVGDAPDGRNVNDGCGSTHPRVVAELTRASGADLGVAFDGDADRVVLADETGEIRDGDAVLYLWGRDLASRDALPGRRLVATSMSNLGLEAALERSGIELVRCDVGDRAVVTTMREVGAVLGGEQSGHIVHLGQSTTGDGLLTALVMAELRVRLGRPLSRLAAGLESYPQLIRNVRVREKVPFESLPAVLESRGRVTRALGAAGRLVLRYSGTEPLARIMIEGRERSHIEALAEELAAVIDDEIGP